MAGFRNAFISGQPVVEGRGGGAGSWIIFYTSLFVFSFSITCIYHAMRGILRLGGFVATGGPYQIAHQAPDWVWILPASMFLMMISIFVSLFATSSRVSGPNLMSLSWSAIFVALGWNFLEFGFGIGMGGEFVWGWIICAAFFIPMGLIPLIFILRSFGRAVEKRRSSVSDEYPGASSRTGEVSWEMSLLAQVLLAGGAVWLAVIFFRSMA